MCFFEPAWLFYLKFNLSKTIYFLKRTWFLYVLWNYQGIFKVLQWNYQRIFKVLQWNARLWKTPTLKIAQSSPGNSIFIGHASNPQKRKELFSLKGTTFVSSDWWIIGLTPLIIDLMSYTIILGLFYIFVYKRSL